MTRRTNEPPPPVTVREILNATIWGKRRQYAVVCAPCGGQVISVNVSLELAHDEARDHAATHAEQTTAP